MAAQLLNDENNFCKRILSASSSTKGAAARIKSLLVNISWQKWHGALYFS